MLILLIFIAIKSVCSFFIYLGIFFFFYIAQNKAKKQNLILVLGHIEIINVSECIDKTVKRLIKIVSAFNEFFLQ